ncbi:hypothetical protein [Muriicola sp.]|uniref:hypothetical protein n=1 Tax=Muriicola sp. TaxID=2020856 RepID=UPI003C72B31B
MKANKSFFIFFILLLCCSTFGIAQGSNIVTLNVNSNEINSENVLQSCFFTWEKPDGTISTSGSGPELQEWLITVDESEIIEWKGKSSSSEDVVVNIIQIKRESGTKIFNGNILKGNGDPSGEKIRAKPSKKTNSEDGDYKYKIKFKVKGVNGTFRIDPKIKVN